jgi:hypothetical protein
MNINGSKLYRTLQFIEYNSLQSYFELIYRFMNFIFMFYISHFTDHNQSSMISGARLRHEIRLWRIAGLTHGTLNYVVN